MYWIFHTYDKCICCERTLMISAALEVMYWSERPSTAALLYSKLLLLDLLYTLYVTLCAQEERLLSLLPSLVSPLLLFLLLLFLLSLSSLSRSAFSCTHGTARRCECDSIRESAWDRSWEYVVVGVMRIVPIVHSGL